mmetsp:Transcript_130850/g.279958  ORF Transcript_130850/g.279958 Transcript_130850/m.279958 type:complete len:249 (-) Transcript_130850:778-1524(-)
MASAALSDIEHSSAMQLLFFDALEVDFRPAPQQQRGHPLGVLCAAQHEDQSVDVWHGELHGEAVIQEIAHRWSNITHLGIKFGEPYQEHGDGAQNHVKEDEEGEDARTAGSNQQQPVHTAGADSRDRGRAEGPLQHLADLDGRCRRIAAHQVLDHCARATGGAADLCHIVPVEGVAVRVETPAAAGGHADDPGAAYSICIRANGNTLQCEETPTAALAVGREALLLSTPHLRKWAQNKHEDAPSQEEA